MLSCFKQHSTKTYWTVVDCVIMAPVIIVQPASTQVLLFIGSGTELYSANLGSVPGDTQVSYWWYQEGQSNKFAVSK